MSDETKPRKQYKLVVLNFDSSDLSQIHGLYVEGGR